MTLTDQRGTDAASVTVAPGETIHAARGGPGAPVASRARRATSRDPAHFAVPSGREEEWRFTPLARLDGLLEQGSQTVEVQVDVTAPETVLVSHVPTADPRVGSVLRPADRVSAVALSQLSEALLVRVPRDTTVTEPVLLAVRSGPGTSYGHLVVDVEPYARVTVVVDHRGTGTRASNVELRVGDGARLTFVSVHDQDRDAVHVEAQAALVGRDARLVHVVVTLGGDLIRLTPTVRFGGPGGEADLAGLFLTSAGQHHEHQLFVDHEIPQCRSRVTYKGALQGERAHSVWVGDVHIGATAQGTDTYELNRNLVLTDGARADSVPNLEIETGDVTGAGHASATGRFDDEQLFYCMARGIPADDARRLVVRGFFAEVLARIDHAPLRERLLTAVDALLEPVVAGVPA